MTGLVTLLYDISCGLLFVFTTWPTVVVVVVVVDMVYSQTKTYFMLMQRDN